MPKVPAHKHIIGPSHRLNAEKCQNSAAINIWDIRRAKRLQRGLKRTDPSEQRGEIEILQKFWWIKPYGFMDKYETSG